MRAQFLLAALALGAFAQQQSDVLGQGQQDQGQGQGQQIQGQIQGQGQDQQQGQPQLEGQQQQQGGGATATAAGQQPGAEQSQPAGAGQSQPAAAGQSGAASASAAAPAASGTATGPAPVVESNAVGPVWTAQFPEKNESSIKGYVSATANANGTGIVWSVNIANLPAGLGQFLYHVHENPVPADGNCTGAGAHLDPQLRGEKPPCDPSQGLASCQVGDLAGKHGNISEDPFQVFYLDRYTSTTKGAPAFIGNRSIVIHDKFTNRLTCANLTRVDTANSASPSAAGGSNSTSCSGGSGSSSSGGSGGSSDSSPSAAGPTDNSKAAQASASASPQTGAAASVTQSLTAVVGIAAFVALAL